MKIDLREMVLLGAVIGLVTASLAYVNLYLVMPDAQFSVGTTSTLSWTGLGIMVFAYIVITVVAAAIIDTLKNMTTKKKKKK